MKQSTILVILTTVFLIVANAQSNNIGLLVKTVYVNSKTPLIINTGCIDAANLNYQVSNGRIEKNNETVFLIAEQKGDVEVKVLNGDTLIAFSKFKAKEMPPFIVTIGDVTNNSISVARLKLETGLKCVLPDYMHEDDYKVVEATVYFSGAGFETVYTATMGSNSFVSIRPFLERCTAGSIINFEFIKVKGPDGIKEAQGFSVVVY